MVELQTDRVNVENYKQGTFEFVLFIFKSDKWCYGQDKEMK
jgi:hypothetical protein